MFVEEKEKDPILESLSYYARPQYFEIRGGVLRLTTYKASKYPENYTNFIAWLQDHFQARGEIAPFGSAMEFSEPKSIFITATQLLHYGFAGTYRDNDKFIELARFAIQKYTQLEEAEGLIYLNRFSEVLDVRYQKLLGDYLRFVTLAQKLEVVFLPLKFEPATDDLYSAAQIRIQEIESLALGIRDLHKRIIDTARQRSEQRNELAFLATSAIEIMRKMHDQKPQEFQKAFRGCFRKEVSIEFFIDHCAYILKESTEEFEHSNDPDKYCEFDKLQKKVSTLVDEQVPLKLLIERFETFVEYLKKAFPSLYPLLQLFQNMQSPMFHQYNSQESPLIAVICDRKLTEQTKMRLLEELVRAKKYNQDQWNRNICGRDSHYCMSSPLGHAVKISTCEVVELLLKNNAAVNEQVDERTPLHWAMGRGDLNIVKLLVKYGANVNVLTKKTKETPLHLAENAECAAFLIESGAAVNARDANGDTPLHAAAKKQVKETSQYGFIPRQEEIDEKHQKRIQVLGLLEVLIRNKAEINAMNAWGQTPLHLACLLKINHEFCDFETATQKIKMLCVAGADVNIYTNIRKEYWNEGPHKIKESVTPLLVLHTENISFVSDHFPVEGFLEIIRILLSYKADVNAKDKSGKTMLHYVAKYCEPRAMDFLLKHRANPNAQHDKTSVTPLHELMYNRRWDSKSLEKRDRLKTCLTLLLKAGADPRKFLSHKVEISFGTIDLNSGLTIGDCTMALILGQENQFSAKARTLGIQDGETIDARFRRVLTALGGRSLFVEVSMNALQYAQRGKNDEYRPCEENVILFNTLTVPYSNLAMASLRFFCLAEPWRELPRDVCYLVLLWLVGNSPTYASYLLGLIDRGKELRDSSTTSVSIIQKPVVEEGSKKDFCELNYQIETLSVEPEPIPLEVEAAPENVLAFARVTFIKKTNDLKERLRRLPLSQVLVFSICELIERYESQEAIDYKLHFSSLILEIANTKPALLTFLADKQNIVELASLVRMFTDQQIDLSAYRAVAPLPEQLEILPGKQQGESPVHCAVSFWRNPNGLQKFGIAGGIVSAAVLAVAVMIASHALLMSGAIILAAAVLLYAAGAIAKCCESPSQKRLAIV